MDVSRSLGALEEGLLQPPEASVRLGGVFHQMDAQFAQILKRFEVLNKIYKE